MSTEADDPKAVGRALREERGTLSVEQASELSGLSRQWWYTAEAGERNGAPVRIRPNSLARALRAVDGDLARVFAVAGYDPRPFQKPKKAEPNTTAPAGEQDVAGVLAEISGRWVLWGPRHPALGLP